MKILVIKLGALGDVLRTLPIVKAIKDKYPDSVLEWVTKKESLELLQRFNFIDKVLEFPINHAGNYDLLYNFDIDAEATELSKIKKSKKKFGFYKENGFLSVFNLGAEYYLSTILDDKIKKENKKTYQEMMFEVIELPYKKEQVLLKLKKEELAYGLDFFKKNNLSGKNVIGIHIGASSRWPSKIWHKNKVIKFIKLAKSKQYEVLIFSGKEDYIRRAEILSDLSLKNIKVAENNPNNTIIQFASLINLCQVMVCSDSFALHLSLALGKKTIGLFFCTSPEEIEEYRLLRKVVSPLLYDFFPERMNIYDEKLTNSINSEEVFNKVSSLEAVRVVNGIIRKKGEDKFLVILRKDSDAIHGGKWAFPGGIIEEGESVKKAIERELSEEVGIKLHKTIKKISDYQYKRPDGKLSFGECFYVSVKKEDILLGKEVADYKWASIEELESIPHIKSMVRELLRVIELESTK